MGPQPEADGRIVQDFRERRTDRLSKADMGHDPAAEERVRMNVLTERADGVDRDQALDSQLLESEYVSPVVDLGREEPMTLAVAGQEGHPAAFERPDDIGAGRVSEGRSEPDFALVLETFDLVEPGAAEDADLRPRRLCLFGPGHGSSSVPYTFFGDAESSGWRCRFLHFCGENDILNGP
jgi:hypothetical protein